MNISIYFNNKSLFGTVKINDVIANRNLPPEFEGMKTLCAKAFPQNLLRFSLQATKKFGLCSTKNHSFQAYIIFITTITSPPLYKRGGTGRGMSHNLLEPGHMISY